MSHAVSSWAWSQKCASTSQKLVLVKLADSANDDGVCWPSLRTLERDLGMTRSTVARHVKSLGAAGLLTVEERRHADGGLRSNLYHLHRAIPEGGVPPGRDTPVPPGRDTLHRLGGTPLEPPVEPIGENATASSRARPVFDALVVACYGKGKTWRDLTRSAQGEVHGAANQLEALGASADDVHERADAYRRHKTLGGVMLTPSALAKHWPGLASHRADPASAPCPECGVGGGQHLADCPTLAAA